MKVHIKCVWRLYRDHIIYSQLIGLNIDKGGICNVKKRLLYKEIFRNVKF